VKHAQGHQLAGTGAGVNVPTDRPLCPRCGYDQSGLWATRDEALRWRAASGPGGLGPGELGSGTCAECGLVFEWRAALFPFEQMTPGFVEHVERRVLLAAWRTMIWCCVPGVFWTRVKLEHRVVPRRWLAWFAAVLVVPWLVISLAMTVQSVLSIPPGRNWWADLKLWEWMLNRWTWPVATWGMASTTPTSPWSWSAWYLTVRDWWYVVPPIAANALLALMIFSLSGTWRAARVRGVHLARAAVFGIGWAGALALVSTPLHGLAWALDAMTAPSVFPRGLAAINMVWREQGWLAWAAVAWVLWWWDRALVVGLRIRLRWFERALVALAGVLVGLLATVVLGGGRAVQWLV
jgi:hypothetical protein